MPYVVHLERHIIVIVLIFFFCVQLLHIQLSMYINTTFIHIYIYTSINLYEFPRALTAERSTHKLCVNSVNKIIQKKHR